MGEEISTEYNRGQRINNLEKERNRLEKEEDKMWNNPIFSVAESMTCHMMGKNIGDHINSLKEMDNRENNFCKNVNLDDYKNSDGSFNVYKVERPLNSKGGEGLYKMSNGAHHEGLAIGNGKNFFYSDYGVNEGNLGVRFWDGKDNKEKWEKMEKVGKSYASDKEVKDILFGQKSEKWANPNDYNILARNCKDYSNEKIKDFKEKKNK